ncbi:hypothetical protein C442_14215 [Haloarcula amylolytica JCM 13557]|uniref:Uncharacterized protein n=1 Tax=Haloarcula amylolytica JCM 13557 TaxID=1227452 RepID=M0KF27_9EURY|nr:hypothetical protein C442_14215 [Haloarcula amylolytica JCM 13557]
MNLLLSSDAIRRHLNTLEDAGVVRVREFEPGNRLRDFPYQFFESTEGRHPHMNSASHSTKRTQRGRSSI